MKKANAEGWFELRKKADVKSTALAQQRTAAASADNATIAQRVKTKLLKRLEKEIDALPELIGTEMNQAITNMEYGGEKKNGKLTKRTEGNKTYKLRDLTAAYRDLTEDMNLNTNSEPVRIIIDV